MSNAAIITIAVVVIVVLAAIVLVTAARRADVRGAGALSRDTRRRDKDADIDLPAAQTGRAVERAVSEDAWHRVGAQRHRQHPKCGSHRMRTPSASAGECSSTAPRSR